MIHHGYRCKQALTLPLFPQWSWKYWWPHAESEHIWRKKQCRSSKRASLCGRKLPIESFNWNCILFREGRFWRHCYLWLDWASRWPTRHVYVAVSQLLHDFLSLGQQRALSLLLGYSSDTSGRRSVEKKEKINRKMWEIINTKPSAHLPKNHCPVNHWG